MTASCFLTMALSLFAQTAEVSHLGTLTDGLEYPGRLAPTPGGGLYVTDEPLGQVLEYDAGGLLVGTYAIPELPLGIAVGTDGRVYVSRLDGEVGIYDAAFTEQGLLDPTPVTMVAPNDIAVHPGTGEIFVVDSGGHQVLVFDGTTGILVRAWGEQGSGLSQFQSPQAIAIYTDANPANDRVIVTDVDNFRVQTFDTSGAQDDKFGYRILYTGSGEVAWFARSEGLAVDSCGHIYLADALMGTVRVFDISGSELDADFVPVIDFGTGPGQVRVPCDLAIDSTGKLYVASTNNAAVEMYQVTCTSGRPGRGGLPGRGGPPGRGGRGSLLQVEQSDLPARAPSRPDNPFDIVEAMNNGTYSRRLDVNYDRQVDIVDLELTVEHFGGATVEDFLNGSGHRDTYPDPLQPPHMIDSSIICGRCHSMDGLPGGMLSAEGNENLCLSCHSASGLAMGKPISGVERGNSHPRGIPADTGDSDGPDPNDISEMALHLDNGDIRCGTCHDPMTSEQGSPYLRASIEDANLCGECHRQKGAQWSNAGHSDATSTAFTYPTGPGRESCARCHTGLGFIDYAAGVPEEERRTDPHVLSCYVCHDPHESSEPHLLRLYGEVTLPGDYVVPDAGDSAICMNCHNGRGTSEERSTPHYTPAAVVLTGINGIDFGHSLGNSAHTTLARCVDCHMAPSPAEGNPGAGKVGEHSFNMEVHDPEDPDYGFENAANACGTCHPGLTTLNRTAWGDYDGNGFTEGIMDEVQGLLDLVMIEIENAGAVYLGHYPYWDFSGVAPEDDELVRAAVWNYELVENDESLGVHNTEYMVGLLQATYRELAGVDVPGATLRYTYGPNARRGGLMWDKWWVVAGAAEPTGDHPLYPPIGQKSGSTTYRCKECHGWDYKGAAGVYGDPLNSHYTGIPGIWGTAMTEQELFDIIRNPDGDGTGGTTVNGHDFGAYGLSDSNIQDLVRFIADELIDTDLYIDGAGAFTGDVGNGYGYYSGALDANVSCYLCHGNDGRAIDFGVDEFLGDLADGNPWEVLHKIRFGHPGTAMPSLVDLAHTAQDAADVGVYAQTLPNGAAVGGDVIRGGLMWDKWWKVNGATEPTGDHPLYPPIGQKSGSTTFRCKECHGWDYIGDLGRYESGSHYTGIPGVLGTLLTDPELFDIIKNPDGDGSGGTTVNGHDFGVYGLSDTDIDDLVAFIGSGVVDTGPYINRAGTPGNYTYSFNGDTVAGASLYDGSVDPIANCAMCHGADGTAIDFGGAYLGDVASGNPQETLHKVRLGQPAAAMCSYVNLGLTDQQAADVGAYSATLPLYP